MPNDTPIFDDFSQVLEALKSRKSGDEIRFITDVPGAEEELKLLMQSETDTAVHITSSPSPQNQKLHVYNIVII